MRHPIRTFAVAVLVALPGSVLAMTVPAHAANWSEDKVTICHATPPDTAANGWQEITVDLDGLNGHGDHPADIIPETEYNDAQGDQSILENHCVQPEEPTTTTTTTLPPHTCEQLETCPPTTTTTVPVVVSSVPTPPSPPQAVPVASLARTGASHAMRDAGIALAAITLGFALLASPRARRWVRPTRTDRFGR
jgi:hypothetical protein